MTSTTVVDALRGRCLRPLLLAASVLVAACDGDPAAPGDEAAPTAIALAAHFPSAASGDDGDAYDAANTVEVRLTAAGTVVFQEVRPFDPSATETRLRIELELEEQTTLQVEIELRRGQDPLFRGSTSLTVVPGATEEADIDLQAVPAGIDIPPSPGPLTSVGETVELGGAVLFATGDTARALELSWTALDPGVADLVGSGAAAMASAVADGEARFRASHASFSETLTILVEIRVVAVEVEPASSTIPVGQTVQLTATARDALDNPVPGRTPTWLSSDPSVASVDANGLVRGQGTGTAEISATVGDVVGTAEVEVFATPPTVTTAQPLGVGHREAQLRALVNPNGTATTARFEWGTDPSLTDPNTTRAIDVGSGTTDQTVGTTVTGLAPGTSYYYRAVASNEAGTVEGEIVGFETLDTDLPTVTTLPATDIGVFGATLNGTVNPNGAATNAWFEWSDNSSFDGFGTTPELSVGSGSEDVAIDADLDLSSEGEGFEPESTYYFRAAATNSEGTARGSVRSFRTAIPAPTDLDGGFDGPTVFLGWDDNSITNTYFRVERSETSSTSGFEVVGIVSDDASDFDRDFFDEGDEGDPLPTGTLYYRVFACNDDECSDASNVHSVVNLPSIGGVVQVCETICFTPSGIEVTLNGPVDRTTTTSSSGFYQFLEVPTGTYTVTVDGDFCPEVLYVFDPNAKEVTVSSGGEFASVDFTGSEAFCPGLQAAVPGKPGRTTPPPASWGAPAPVALPAPTR